MKKVSYKNFTRRELEKELAKLRRIFLDFQNNRIQNKLEKPHLFRKTKKDIACILTYLHQIHET